MKIYTVVAGRGARDGATHAPRDRKLRMPVPRQVPGDPPLLRASGNLRRREGPPLHRKLWKNTSLSGSLSYTN